MPSSLRKPQKLTLEDERLKKSKELLERADVTLRVQPKDDSIYAIVQGTGHGGEVVTLRIEFDIHPRNGTIRTFYSEPGKPYQELPIDTAVTNFIEAKAEKFAEISEIHFD